MKKNRTTSHEPRTTIFIIAGEVSGDVLGAKIMQAMPDARFVGIGGENMQAAGLKSIFPISDLAVMGFVEVLLKAKTLTRRINETVNAIIHEKPDIVLTIDSSSFAKQVIRKVKKLGVRGEELGVRSEELGVNRAGDNARALKQEQSTPNFSLLTPNSSLLTPNSSLLTPNFYHVVAPQVWAWGEKRAKKFAAIFDRLYAFFDFEVPYFTKYGLETIPVGHPIACGLRPQSAELATRSLDDLSSVALAKEEEWCGVHSADKNITLVPGSRISEVKKLLPVFKEVVGLLGAGASPLAGEGRVGLRAKRVSNSWRGVSPCLAIPPTDATRRLPRKGRVAQNRESAPEDSAIKFFIPVVETTREYIEKEIASWPVKPELVSAAQRYELFSKTDLAIAASGTASVELAIMHVPAVVVYKMNPVTTFFARFIVKTKWVSLVNVLLKKTVYPELLGSDCSAENIVKHAKELITPTPAPIKGAARPTRGQEAQTREPTARKEMIAELSKADKMWQRSRPAAELIAEDIMRDK
jgi:lipid-A-disaccharide synthase